MSICLFHLLPFLLQPPSYFAPVYPARFFLQILTLLCTPPQIWSCTFSWRANLPPTVNVTSYQNSSRDKDYTASHDILGVWVGVYSVCAWPSCYDHRPSHPYYAGTEHVGFSPTKQTLLAPSAKRRVVFGESHEGWTASFQEPLVRRTSAPCACFFAYGWKRQGVTLLSDEATPETAIWVVLLWCVTASWYLRGVTLMIYSYDVFLWYILEFFFLAVPRDHSREWHCPVPLRPFHPFRAPQIPPLY